MVSLEICFSPLWKQLALFLLNAGDVNRIISLHKANQREFNHYEAHYIRPTDFEDATAITAAA